MKKKHILTLVGVAFSLPLVQAGTVIINFTPNTQGGNQLNHAAEVASGTIFSTANIDGTSPISTGTGRGSLGGVTISEGGFTGVFNISLQIDAMTPTVTTTPVERGGVGALGVLAGGGLNGAQESLTISNLTFDFVSGDDVFQFDGFSGIFIGNVTPGETAQLNGGDPFSPAADGSNQILEDDPITSLGGLFSSVTLAGGTNVAGTAAGAITLEGINAEFSVIPEPSSVLLLGLSGLALLRRRR